MKNLPSYKEFVNECLYEHFEIISESSENALLSRIDGYVLIGSISADPQDSRYKDVINVYVKDDKVYIESYGTAPYGGMDSSGTDIGYSNIKRTVVKRNPKDVLQAVKYAISNSRIIKSYGKPTKNFRWKIDGNNEYGLSINLVKAAVR